MPALLALAVATIAALAPAATTKPATDVAATSATLHATVDPQGSATSVRFDLGTSTSYGLQSAAKDVGAGSTAVDVAIPVQGLTADTTYHARVVATSAGGTTKGADVTLRTAKSAQKPAVTIGGVSGVTGADATLSGKVDPNRQPTTFHFDWGRTRSYGSSTPESDAGTGDSARTVRGAIGGLAPKTTYHYRLVATNASGVVRSADRSFTTAATPTAAAFELVPERVPYGTAAALAGRLTGPKVSGVRVRLQTTPFPFSAPLTDTGATARTDRNGRFRFTLSNVTIATRAVVIANDRPPVLTRVVEIRCAVRIGLSALRREGGRLAVAGRVFPVTPAGRVSIQRRAADGRWLALRRVRPAADGTFATTVRAPLSATQLRAVAVPHDGGAHSSAATAPRRVAGRRHVRR